MGTSLATLLCVVHFNDSGCPRGSSHNPVRVIILHKFSTANDTFVASNREVSLRFQIFGSRPASAEHNVENNTDSLEKRAKTHVERELARCTKRTLAFIYRNVACNILVVEDVSVIASSLSNVFARD